MYFLTLHFAVFLVYFSRGLEKIKVEFGDGERHD